MQSSIMDALFCNDQEQVVVSQQQLQSSDQDHHRPPPPPLANSFLDYTPDLTTETPDDDPMTSFDDFYMSPQVSSYLQYLKEDPSPMERWPVLQDWLGLDTNNYASNEFLLGLPTTTTTTNTTTTAAPTVSASDPPTSDWLYDPSHCYFPADHRPSIDSSACTDDLQDLIGMGGMTRDFVSLSVSVSIGIHGILSNRADTDGWPGREFLCCGGRFPKTCSIDSFVLRCTRSFASRSRCSRCSCSNHILSSQ